MADITTQTIRDTFLDNLPENVTREEGEAFWNAWLNRQREGHEPDMPTPPVGFQYAPGEVDEFDYGEPDLEDEQLTEDQKRDMLGLVHDYAMNTSELARTMLDCQHFDDPQIRALRVPQVAALRPQADIAPAPWVPATQGAARDFSAVAWFFARRAMGTGGYRPRAAARFG